MRAPPLARIAAVAAPRPDAEPVTITHKPSIDIPDFLFLILQAGPLRRDLPYRAGKCLQIRETPLVTWLKSHNEFAGKLVKIYATPLNPREVLNRRDIDIAHVIDSPLAEDGIFSCPGREQYAGPELEHVLASKGLSDHALEVARALFRFANYPMIRFVPRAMMVRDDTTNEWLMKHPLDILQGLDKAVKVPWRQSGIHLDLMSRGSLERVYLFINHYEPERLVTEDEGRTIRQKTLESWGIEMRSHRAES